MSPRTVQRYSGPFAPDFYQKLECLDLTSPLQLADGIRNVRAFGKSVPIPVTGITDIWDGGGEYTYPNWGGEYWNICSDSTSDTAVDILLTGLDFHGDLIEISLTLDGRTEVQIPNKMYRVFSFINDGSKAYVGTVYVYKRGTTVTDGVPQITANIRAKGLVAYQRTMMAQYTIPLGYVGLAINLSKCASKGAAAKTVDLQASYRPLNKTFLTFSVHEMVTQGNSHISHEFSPYLYVPELTDIKVSASNCTDDTIVASASFQGVIIPKESVPFLNINL